MKKGHENRGRRKRARQNGRRRNPQPELWDAEEGYSLAVKGLDTDAITNSAIAGKALVKLADTLPNCGDVVSFFTGDNNIADFGDDLVLFGEDMWEYYSHISGIDMGKLSSVIMQVWSLVDLTKGVKDIDKNVLSSFGNSLSTMATTGITGFTMRSTTAVTRSTALSSTC